MYKKFQIGDRVRVNRACGRYRVTAEGKVTALWDFEKGNLGTVARVWHTGGNNAPFLYVVPDPEAGFGEHLIRTKEVENLTRNARGNLIKKNELSEKEII